MAASTSANVDVRQAQNDLTEIIRWARSLKTMLGAINEVDPADLYEATDTIVSLGSSLWDSLDLQDKR